MPCPLLTVLNLTHPPTLLMTPPYRLLAFLRLPALITDVLLGGGHARRLGKNNLCARAQNRPQGCREHRDDPRFQRRRIRHADACRARHRHGQRMRRPEAACPRSNTRGWGARSRGAWWPRVTSAPHPWRLRRCLQRACLYGRLVNKGGGR